MKISDAIRTLLLLRKPIRQPDPSIEMNLELTSNDDQPVIIEIIPAQQSSDTEEEKV
jgi:hypothetical protein